MLLERAKLVVEPAGAVGGRRDPRRQGQQLAGPTVVILSGGNIDPLMMERVISRGLAASERYLKLRIPLPDRPGQLARIAELIAEANANVVEVLHTRHGRGLQISEVELELHIETRGPEHAELVLAAPARRGLRAARRLLDGYRPPRRRERLEISRVGLDLDDLDRDLFAVRGGVLGLRRP